MPKRKVPEDLPGSDDKEFWGDAEKLRAPCAGRVRLERDQCIEDIGYQQGDLAQDDQAAQPEKTLTGCGLTP